MRISATSSSSLAALALLFVHRAVAQENDALAAPSIANVNTKSSSDNNGVSSGSFLGNGSGSSSFAADASVLLPCKATAFESFYKNTNVTQCEVLSQFSFTSPTTALTTTNASSICIVSECASVYDAIVALNLGECQLTETLQLQKDVIWPLMNGNCTGVYADFEEWNKTYGGISDVGGVFTPLPESQEESTDNATVAVIVSVAVGLLLAFTVVVIAVVWYKRQRLRHLQSNHRDPLMDAKYGASPHPGYAVNHSSSGAVTEGSDSDRSREMVLAMPPPPLPPQQYELLPKSSSLWADEDLLPHHMRNEDLEDIRVIGYGGHGVVFLVRYRQTRLLASKRLVKDHVTREKTRALITEIKLVSKLEHPCIVQFVGAAWTTEADLQALFEYMPNGDLCTYLAKTTNDTAWNLNKLKMAMDIAEALIYVHSFAPPLVHRDLKSNNVLLAEDMRAKLSDFGVSRFQSDACTMTLGVGSGRWLAPEVMAGGGEYNQSCDVYALGVVLSEMDTHRLPFSDLRSASGNPMAEVSILQLVSLGQLKPTFTSSCPESVRAIALRCLAFNPKERPSAIEVSYTLRTIAKKEFGL